MVARSEIQLTIGMVLVNIKTNQLWTIKSITASKWRNSGGSTNKVTKWYYLHHNKHQKQSLRLNRGDLLNQFRVLETPAEIVLYGRKDV